MSTAENSLFAKEQLHGQMLAARQAVSGLARAKTADKNAVLNTLAELLLSRNSDILNANQCDLDAMRTGGYAESLLDRAQLDFVRLQAMTKGVREIALLPDPVGSIIADWTVPSGLQIERVRTPIGVIGVIYESRPNVTIDAGVLCFKAGNAVILRGGKEVMHSNRVLSGLFQEALIAHDFNPALVQWVQSSDRGLVGTMLQAYGLIDVIVPRGGKTLVQRVVEEARVPVFAHLEGIVHIYLHAAAQAEMARTLLVNAKMRRAGICGAMECLLIDRAFPSTELRGIFDALIAAGCTLRGCPAACALDERLETAGEDDWGREYLAPVLAVRIVEDQAAAEAHVATYSSGHTEVILTEDIVAAEQFFANVDSAIVMHNASSQFADGGEFGMGAEIGIATGRIHARGPVGLEQLTTFQYRVHGHGEVRP